ncbi:DUF397 domain-containing protein [Streptomyces sp. NPDC048717]|uniref:DUF397 domain-containing protein n=1 Tax=Streptomyces sp. NPDC048717 TaxID=3154928 RepID=UPI003418F83F
MAASLIQGPWFKSRKSEANGMCVQLSVLPEGRYAMANSTDASGPALVFTADEMNAFFEGVVNGDFNALFPRNQ